MSETKETKIYKAWIDAEHRYAKLSRQLEELKDTDLVEWGKVKKLRVLHDELTFARMDLREEEKEKKRQRKMKANSACN